MGDDPSYWQSNSSIWPPSYSRTDGFYDVFGVGPNKTLMAVLSSGSSSELAKWGIAALLNAADGKGPIPTGVVKCMVRDAWGGLYHAGPGCDWDEVEVVDYFKWTVGM
jgi:hypothetical protein